MTNDSGSGNSGSGSDPSAALAETSFVTKLPIGRGSVLNNIYRIERQLGVGGMGEVYEAVNIEDGEREAIKIISTSLAEQEKVEALFRREAKMMRKLSAPEIAQLRFFARDPAMNVLYIVTEFVDGPSLASLLNRKPASVADVRTLLRRVGKGLRSAHELGLIHRDISPDNILLPDGRVENAKIIDFGIAKDVTNKGTTIIGDSFVGKLSYASPEVFAFGKSEVGPWSDIYSLGLVGAAFALGEPLNMGQSFPEAMAARQSKINLDDIPVSLQHVLGRMLEPDWHDRMQSIDEMLVALEPTAAIVPSAAPSRAPVLQTTPSATVDIPPPQPNVPQQQHFTGVEPAPRAGRGKMIALVAVVALVLGLAIPSLLAWVNGGRGVPDDLAAEMLAPDKTDDPATWQILYAVREVGVRPKPVVSSSAPLAMLKRGASLKGAIVPGIKDPTKPWLLIQEGPHKGHYVSAINLSKNPPPAIDASTSADLTMVGDSEVRSAPYASASVLPDEAGQLTSGTPIKVTGTVNGNWAEITLKGGGVGYLPWNNISGEELGAAEASTGRLVWVRNECQAKADAALYYSAGGAWQDNGGQIFSFEHAASESPLTVNGRHIAVDSPRLLYGLVSLDGIRQKTDGGTEPVDYGGTPYMMEVAVLTNRTDGGYTLNLCR
jgi:serine/threonine protein kinase